MSSPGTELPLAELEEMQAAFTPRHHWTNGSFGRSTEQPFELVCLLHQLRAAGSVTLGYQHIPCVPFDEKRWYREQEPEERAALAVAARRRGSELQDQTWSGYCYLKSLFPGRKFETYRDGIPFLYLERESGAACTAGNVEPGRMLHMVVARDISRLFIVGNQHSWREERPAGNHEMLDSAVLSFDDNARAALSDFFDGQVAALQRKLNEAHQRLMKEAGKL